MNTKSYSHTYMTRNFTAPKAVQEQNFDGWSECDNCGRKMGEFDDVFTHWHTVYTVYYSFEKEPFTKEDFKFFKEYKEMPEFSYEHDNFAYVTCSKKCSHKKRNGDK